jgi:hypothetical protein
MPRSKIVSTVVFVLLVETCFFLFSEIGIGALAFSQGETCHGLVLGLNPGSVSTITAIGYSAWSSVLLSS